MKIINYINVGGIRIRFLDEHEFEIDSTYGNFKSGQISNPYDKRTYGVGYKGDGKYVTRINKANSIDNITWHDIIRRCYCEDYINKHPAYRGCSVAEEWHNFQNFAEWYHENYYDIGEGRIHIDKDILVKGNRIYSPDTCLIVPQRINMIFMNKPNKWNLPNGISMSKTGKYITNYNGKHLGIMKTLDEAINAHDKEMRIHIKNITEEYKGLLPDKVRDALLNW